VTLPSTEIYDNTGEVALHYNRIKVAENPGDQMTRQHTRIPQTKRCPLRLFMEKVNIVAATIYNIWMEKKKCSTVMARMCCSETQSGNAPEVLGRLCGLPSLHWNTVLIMCFQPTYIVFQRPPYLVSEMPY